MIVRSVDPRAIPDTCKEAVVDSLLNNLGARVSGARSFYRVILGTHPSRLLVSGFILPRPIEERAADEEADPIRISTHGLDFQLDARTLERRVRVELSGSVYVRVLPTAAEVQVGGRLHPIFPLNSEAKANLRQRIKAALDALRTELRVTRREEGRHPQWAVRSLVARRRAHEEMGVPFEPARTAVAEEPFEPGATDEVGEDIEAEAADALDRPDSANVPQPEIAPNDDIFQPIPPPPKWLRVDLTLPAFEFSIATASSDAEQATVALNASIEGQLRSWCESPDPSIAGRLWGYRRRNPILPSDLRNWAAYLARVRAANASPVVPVFDLRWNISVTQDPLHADRSSIHLAVENWTIPPNKQTQAELECSLFQVKIVVDVPHGLLRPLTLDRVKASYRYNRYLRYPALGFNGGVKQTVIEGADRLTTTWTPRYVLPRIVQANVPVELRFAELAKPSGLMDLDPLLREYRRWVNETRKTNVEAGIEGPTAAEQIASEQAKLAEDLKAWERELQAIESGVELLKESARYWAGPGLQGDPRGIPCEAWFAMNAAMHVVGGKKYDSWRLFQLAFIISSIPTFATRIPQFHHYFKNDVAEQANAVTLLYFATGGGKSEAFLGLLLFVLLLDRLRGKERGVSALMRYPLRLLTLQQARRTMAVLAAGEIQRVDRGYPGEPFSLGFWVGSGNTPNWHGDDGLSHVPTLATSPLDEESTAKELPPYVNYRKQWLKIEQCPFCRSEAPVALRRSARGEDKLLGHYCTASKEVCRWNRLHDDPTPLPFYIVDEDIYGLAPSVLLGTVDKLAVIGQSYRTIRLVFGMFGLAPFRSRATGRLYTPLLRTDWDQAAEGAYEPLFPAYDTGTRAFFDPFPSLLIQDEAHLLEESLGTFAGLFESSFEAALDRVTRNLGDLVCLEPGSQRRRGIKVIAASATVSEPRRQMRNLYQRDDTLQFPYPGPDLYRSFYALPKLPPPLPENHARLALDDIELRSHGARTYAAILTNGHRHTVAMATILGHYHLIVTELYEDLRSGDLEREQAARVALVEWLSESPLEETFRTALEAASGAALLTLVDLHRISLTYVTNKKGGDQVIDTERAQFESLHRAAGFEEESLLTRLISGAVSASEIQSVVREAESRVNPGDAFPELSKTLRSIIATSAVSHGVDVEEFNAMFFAGLPSDIAEYIQASSRIGRSHAGFSLLVPVPQRHRDRFVTEIFDIFHRFLERMVLPAAVDRWADKAIRRVIPSILQEYLCGISRIQEIAARLPAEKCNVRDFRKTKDVREYLLDSHHVEELIRFVIDALGLEVRPPPDGEAYYRALVKQELSHYRKCMEEVRLQSSDFRQFFEQINQALRPMTSLRDVDQPGWIFQSAYDVNWKRTRDGQTAAVMDFIRRGVGRELEADGVWAEGDTR
jgi:hypothetical protein